MTNLEWIRTLSAKELSDLLYDYWLPRGQYVWTDSRKGLTKMLGENYLERDCNKCKRQDNCYCIKGLGCPFEPKTENSSEIPNNCEWSVEYAKEMLDTMSCEECGHWEHGAHNHYYCALLEMRQECCFESKDESTLMFANQPKDEPQTCEECEHWNDTEDGCADRHGCKDEPQTDCAWKKGE